MSKSVSIEPPKFVSDEKTYTQYKADLEMWSRISGIEKKVQAEMVVYRLEGHPSRIKEKIMTQIADKLKDNDDGIKELIKFLDDIYGKDDMADVWDKFIEFSTFSRKPNQDIGQFTAEWTNSYHKLKTAGCVYPDIILGFKLLEAAKLSDIDTKLVLTGVDYTSAKEKKNLEKQISDSLKKFTGRAVIRGDSCSVAVKTEPTFLTDMEEVFLSKGWKPPPSKKGGRRRSRSVSPVRMKQSNYKGKKNPLGDNQKPLKCYICKCEHTENCTCACVYHLANKCPNRRKKADEGKPDLSLFMNTHFRSDDQVFLAENDDYVLVVKQTLDNLVLLTVDKHEAVVDCACPTTVSGLKWIENFCADLDEKVVKEESNRMFKFGGGEKRQSKGVVTFPCHLAGKNVRIRTEVVDADFPLLLGNSMLKKVGAVLHLREEKAVIMGCEVKMRETSSGHFSLKIEKPKPGVEYAKIEMNSGTDKSILECLLNKNNEELSKADVEKLHHMFGHVSMKRLRDLIDKSNKMNDKVSGYLEDIQDNCRSCRLHQISKPRPAASLPRAFKFNHVVAMDLKHYEEKNFKYILYLVDMFSRLTVGVFISDKKPETVGEKIMEKWIAVFGRMDTLHSDRGGEFCCEELTNVAEYLGVKSSFTAADSPNQNGINERNHAICDRMIVKMLSQDSEMSAEVALTWALAAKNTLQNVSGFSPFQIVFGQNPSLPSVYTTGPPGLEEVVMSKVVADHINALFLAREAYIAGESDRTLKAALKQRIYKRGEDIQIGDWIYFTRNGKWNGPVKVSAKDGKNLYVVRAGKLLTVNSDHAQLADFEGELVSNPSNPTEVKGSDSLPAPAVEGEKDENAAEKDDNVAGCGRPIPVIMQDVADSTVLDGAETNEHETTNQHDKNINNTTNNNNNNNIEVVTDVGEIRRNDVIRFKKNPGLEWIQGRILSRAGKKGGKYGKWWNVQNTVTGHIEPEDLGNLSSLEKVMTDESNGAEENVENEVFITAIPRYRHNEEGCKAAKEKEFDSWDKYAVYEEVKDEGQVRLDTNWVLTCKVVKGVSVIKARLTIRGDQEDTSGIRKDSPTVRRGNIKVFAAVAAKEHWEIKASDVACAFLQGVAIDREVFVLPPKERRVPGVLWKLLKPVYGLVDAPRGWHLALDDELLKTGCEKCNIDPAMYIQFSNDKGEKKLEGIVLTHVDDLLNGGSSSFQLSVMESVKSAFNFGSDETEAFWYTGMNMTQNNDGIVIDQDHYVRSLELPDMEIARGQKMNDVLNAEGQTLFRGCVAKVLYVGYQSRPDVCFEAKCLSTKFGKATKGDLKSVLKKIQKLQGVPTKMVFPDLGSADEWTLVGYGDAGVRSMPDKISSVGGKVILLVNAAREAACVLNWRSKKLVRKIVSSLAGEALACTATIGEIVYIKAILTQLYGEIVNDIPVIVFTDSKNLYEAVYSSSLVEDPWLIPDIAIIKEAVSVGTISCVRRVASGDMLANCLTKAGASADGLMDVLQTGHYVIPPGLDVV